MQKNIKNQSTVFGLVINFIVSILTTTSNFVHVIIAIILIKLFLQPRKIKLLPPIPKREYTNTGLRLETYSFMKRVRNSLPKGVTNVWLDKEEYLEELEQLDWKYRFYYDGVGHTDEMQFLGVKSQAQRDNINDICNLWDMTTLEYLGVTSKEEQKAIYQAVAEENSKIDEDALEDIEGYKLYLSKLCYCHLEYWPYGYGWSKETLINS